MCYPKSYQKLLKVIKSYQKLSNVTKVTKDKLALDNF